MFYKECKCGNTFLTTRPTELLCPACYKKEKQLKAVEPFKIQPRFNKTFMDYVYEKNRKLYYRLQN